jgi:hypothetical protein
MALSNKRELMTEKYVHSVANVARQSPSSSEENNENPADTP